MIRALFLVLVIAGAFAGGFYFGIRYRNQQLVDNPELFMKEYGEVLRETAHEKYEKIKKVLLDD